MRTLSFISIRNLALAALAWILRLGCHPVDGISLYSGPSIVYETRINHAWHHAFDFDCCKIGFFTQINALCFNARCSMLYARVQKFNRPAHYFSMPLSIGVNLFIFYLHTGFIIKTLLQRPYNGTATVGSAYEPMIGLGLGTERIQGFVDISAESILANRRNNSPKRATLRFQLNVNII